MNYTTDDFLGGKIKLMQGDLHLYNLEEFYGYPEYVMACDSCIEYGMLSCIY